MAGLKQGWAFAWRSLMAGELLVIIGQPSHRRAGEHLQEQDLFAGATSILIIILIIGIVVDMLFTTADKAVRRRRGLLEAGLAA